ncbi:MAG TPA: AsmA family protein [Geobacteraceae bacterium]|nr:AsmA family protein [Geobacteraceae bacterium]
MIPRKFIIVFGVILATLVVLTGGASLLVKLLVTPEMIRKNILPRMEAALQRPIELGDAKIGIFSGITLRGLTVYERDGKKPFFSVKDAYLRYRLFSLLSRRFVVDEIFLISPRLHVVRYTDGTFNFTDIISKERPSSAERKTLSLAVEEITVTDGNLAYEDRTGLFGPPFTYQLRDIDIKAKDLRPDQPLPAMLKEAEIRLKEARLTAAGYAPVLSGAFTLSDGRLTSRDLAVTLGKNRLAILMSTSSLGKKPLRVQLSAKTDFLDLDALRRAKTAGVPVPSSPARAGGAKPAPLKLPVEITGTVHAGAVARRGITITGLSIRYRITDNILTIGDMRGAMLGGTFTDTARIDLAGRGFPFTTRLYLHGIRADKLVAELAPKAAGSISGVLSAKADLAGFGTTAAAVKRNLSGTGDFHIKNGKLASCGIVFELARILRSEELRVVRFTTLTGTFRIKEEQIFLNAILNGPDIKSKQSGRIGFDNSIDMTMDVNPAPHITGNGGWAVIPVKATGTIGSPNCTIRGKSLGQRIGEKAEDTKELGKDVLKNVETGLKEKKQQVEKTLRGILHD